MGFLDKAKKLAEQAIDKANESIADARSSSQDKGQSEPAPTSAPDTTASVPGPAGTTGSGGLGTPYVPGMLGRPGWRERDLVDPAALLPMWDRERAGVPHSTKSQIVEEPFGMGRRWTAEGKSAGLFYRLYPEHEAWAPPAGTVASDATPGATAAALGDGRSLLFIAQGKSSVVLETSAIDDDSRAALARAVAEQLGRQ
jgi:hypothetical protein